MWWEICKTIKFPQKEQNLFNPKLEQVIYLVCHCSFADSCEVTHDGASIKCDCQEGYIGERCERCASGYYGQPEVLGESRIDATGPFTLLYT